MPVSISSLLKSAQARQNKIREQEDSLMAYNYSLSAKTYQDFLDYSAFLDDRASKADPSKALSYQRAINSARSGYVSNEIQRQSIAVVEGRQTNTEKYDSMVGLFYQALDSGNYDLAQSLNLQIDNLSVTIQNEREAAQRAAGTMAMNGVKTLDALIKKMKSGQELIELPDGTVVKPLSMLSAEVGAAGETPSGYFQEALATITALRQTIESAYMGATTQEAVDSIESKYAEIMNGTETFKTAAGNLTEAEIELGYRSALANNPLYSPESSLDETTGQQTFKLVKNKIDDFVWARNDDGTYIPVQTRAKVLSPQQKLDAKLTDTGFFLGEADGKNSNINAGANKVNTDAGLSIKDRLRNQGIEATGNEDGTITLITPEGTFQGTIMPDGSVRYFGPQGQFSGQASGLYEIDILGGGIREVAPDETSIFGTRSVFGGQLSKASDAGVNIATSLAGGLRVSSELFGPSKITNLQNDFTGRGAPVIGGNLQGSTSILENAAQTRAAILQAEAAANRLQPSSVFNLNQTPVQQFASNGAPIKQLTVAPPMKTPTLRVAAPPPLAPVPKVSVAQNVTKVTGVKPLPAQPKLTVR